MLFPESLKLVTDTLWRIDNKDMAWAIEDLFTPSEIVELGERLRIMKELDSWKTQREVASDIWVSVTTVSRGARVLKYWRGVIKKYL